MDYSLLDLIKKEKLVSFSLCLLLNFPLLTYATINICNSIFGHSLHWVTVLMYAANFLIILVTCLLTMDRVSCSRFVFTGLFVIALVLTYAFNEKTRPYMWTKVYDFQNNPIYLLFINGYTAFLLSDYLHDVSMFLQMLFRFSRVSVVFAALHFFLGAATGNYPSYMTFSYNLLFPTVFLWTCPMSFSTVLLAVLGSVLILIAGCRGALLCLLLGGVVFLFFFREMKPSTRFLVIFFSVILTLVIILFWTQIIGWISSITDALGVTSRTVNKLNGSDFLDDSGRSRIIRLISLRSDFFGAGLFGDRTMTGGRYAHSIFYELVADFGWVLGIALFIMWVWLIIFALAKADEPGRRLMCVLLPGGCFKLFLSGSFLSQEPAFYMLLGVALNCVMIYKNTQRFRRDMYSRILLNEKMRPHENIQQDLAQSKMSDQTE